MTVWHVLVLTLPVLVPGLTLIATLKLGWGARLRVPLDAGRRWRGTPILGPHKTWWGLLLYVVGGALVAAVVALVSLVGPAGPAVLTGGRAPLVGASIGAAYSLGEALNSLVKRRRGIAAGTTTASRWAPLQRALDLADGIVLAGATYLAWGVPTAQALAVVVAGLAIHVATDALMRALSLKRQQ